MSSPRTSLCLIDAPLKQMSGAPAHTAAPQVDRSILTPRNLTPVLCCALTFLFLLSSCTGAPGYQGHAGSPFNFDGKKFSNLSGLETGQTEVMKIWLEGRKTTESSLRSLPVEPSSKELDEVRATFINHATVLIEIAGYRILTDPLYSQYAGPWSIGSPSRGHAPGVAFENLPPIDLVILSHDHFDHLDIPTLVRLDQRNHPLVLGGLGTAALLSEHGITNTIDLAWFEALALKALRLIFLPAEHGARRSLADGYNTLWGSFLLRGESGAVYFAGDTGWGDHFQNIRLHYGAPDLALLPLRASKPASDRHPAHINAEQAVMAHLALGAKKSMAVHFGTLGNDYRDRQKRVLELQAALLQHHVPQEDYLIPRPGEALTLLVRSTPNERW